MGAPIFSDYLIPFCRIGITQADAAVPDHGIPFRYIQASGSSLGTERINFLSLCKTIGELRCFKQFDSVP